MIVATWNVNSIKARLPNVLEWLREAKPDVVLLQEIKCVDDDFPGLEIEDLGYNLAVHGQKTYNGVAILSKRPIEDVARGLAGGPGDEQARYIEATISGVRLASVYVPNGNPVTTEKFAYKLAWFDRLIAHVRALLRDEYTFALGGDWNVCPTDEDVYDPDAFANDALCRPESRAKFRTLLHLGLTGAFRALHPQARRAYSFWDYQGRGFERDNGLRIDDFLLSPQAADLLAGVRIDAKPRGRPKASDHTPVVMELRD